MDNDVSARMEIVLISVFSAGLLVLFLWLALYLFSN